jgi:hypothetical protein
VKEDRGFLLAANKEELRSFSALWKVLAVSFCPLKNGHRARGQTIVGTSCTLPPALLAQPNQPVIQQCFLFITNQRTVLSAMTYQPIKAICDHGCKIVISTK